MSEVLAETTKYRVTIAPDHDAEPPYDDGATPIIALTHHDYNGWKAEQVDSINTYELHPRIIQAAAECASGSRRDIFARYLSIVHGVTSVEVYQDRIGTLYVSFDPADWRELMGIDDEQAQAHRLACMTEWIAYVEGDVWALTIEEKVEYARLDSDERMYVWETVESLTSLYGYEFAESTALEEFGTFVTEIEAVNESIVGVPV